MARSYYTFSDGHEKVLTRTHDDALAEEKQDQRHGYVWGLIKHKIYLEEGNNDDRCSTWRKAMPTAMPATVRRLCSNHSSPACKQPFSFTILSKPTLQRNKTCKRNRNKDLQLIKQSEVLWYLNVQSVLQRCPNLQKNKKAKQGGAHAKHGCLISNDTSSPGPQRKNGKIAKATKQQTDRESQEDQRAWAPTWRTLMATATPATGTRFLSTHSSPARRHPLSYITRV